MIKINKDSSYILKNENNKNQLRLLAVLKELIFLFFLSNVIEWLPFLISSSYY